MVGWHHRHNGNDFEQALGNSEGQGSLACCSPWGRKESDMMEQLNNKIKSYSNSHIVSVIHSSKIGPQSIYSGLKIHKDPFFSACVYSPSVVHPKLALSLHILTWSFWFHDLICAYYFAPKWNSVSVHYHTTYETGPSIIIFLILQVS